MFATTTGIYVFRLLLKRRKGVILITFSCEPNHFVRGSLEVIVPSTGVVYGL
jgi:hypothetical protein